MSLTCQPLPDVDDRHRVLRGDRALAAVSVISWLIVTTKVMLDGPNARSELITALPADTCFFLVRCARDAGHGIALLEDLASSG